MATVTGELATFGFSSLQPYSPEIVFTPSGPTTTALKVRASKPVVVVPEMDQTFSVELTSTDTMRPAAWYTLSIRWLDSGGNFVSVDYPDWKLFVPSAGGDLATLLDVPANPAQVWVGVDPPSGATSGTWWLNPTTGDLYEWSN